MASEDKSVLEQNISALSDEELLTYLKDMSGEMEKLCRIRGFDGLAHVLALIRIWPTNGEG